MLHSNRKQTKTKKKRQPNLYNFIEISRKTKDKIRNYFDLLVQLTLIGFENQFLNKYNFNIPINV